MPDRDPHGQLDGELDGEVDGRHDRRGGERADRPAGGAGPRVRRATRADLDDAARVLGDAFRDEPWTRWTIDARGHRKRVEALQRLALEHIGHPHGEVWVGEVQRTIACVAVWTRSDRPVPDAAWAATVEPQRRLAGNRYEAAVAAEDAVLAHRPTELHAYLATIGTAAAHTGHGVATAVLRAGLERADAAALPAVLETSTTANVRFYERFGFAVVHELTLAGGPTVWTMRRPPAASGAEGAHGPT